MTAMEESWQTRAATVFQCEKVPVSGRAGIAVTNHPLASSVAAEILLSGGNAVDAAHAALFALTVVEPMMVGLLGGGMTLYRSAAGQTVVLDGNCSAPVGTRSDCFQPAPDQPKDGFAALGNANLVGATSVAVPGALPTWCEAQKRWGKLSLADIVEPATRMARRGFTVTPYLSTCIGDAATDILADKAMANWLMPDGRPLTAGDRLANPQYADALAFIGQNGPGALHGGPLGSALVERIARDNGFVCESDLVSYEVREREAVRGAYRGWDVVSAPPPSAAGIHILQMLKILEGFDLRALGFGTPTTLHLLAEAMKIAFADRSEVTADPDYYAVPVDQILSYGYAAARRDEICLTQAQQWQSRLGLHGSPNTTHITVADADGNVVCSTQSINSLFGARILVPETGMIPNNYMAEFDPVPGRTQSIEAGKRVTTSMGPTMVERDGKLRYALGLPGGKRIFPSILQTIINLVDHGMNLQEAVEAPRLFCENELVEVEDAVPERVLRQLRKMGHKVMLVPHVAGGMNGIEFADDGTRTGAGCWRADGTVVATGGGLARPDVRFWTDTPTSPQAV